MLGTSAIELPARSSARVVSNCTIWLPVTLISGFPHMHQLGTGMRIEVGSSADDMREVYRRDPSTIRTNTSIRSRSRSHPAT